MEDKMAKMVVQKKYFSGLLIEERVLSEEQTKRMISETALS